MNCWVTNEFNVSTFSHEGWTITKFQDGAVYVTAPGRLVDIDVSVDPDGLNLCGTSSLYPEGISACFTVPWIVIEQLVWLRKGATPPRA